MYREGWRLKQVLLFLYIMSIDTFYWLYTGHIVLYCYLQGQINDSGHAYIMLVIHYNKWLTYYNNWNCTMDMDLMQSYHCRLMKFRSRFFRPILRQKVVLMNSIYLYCHDRIFCRCWYAIIVLMSTVNCVSMSCCFHVHPTKRDISNFESSVGVHLTATWIISRR